MTLKIFATFLSLLLGLAGTSLTMASWDSSSVWDAMKERSNAYEGTIQAIAIDERSGEIILRIQREHTDDRKHHQTLRLCGKSGESYHNFLKSEQLHLLREAMARGKKVRLGFDSAFERCLSTVVAIRD